jgi:hypothetical protein
LVHGTVQVLMYMVDKQYGTKLNVHGMEQVFLYIIDVHG